uniref:Uncharacterized protein n=1 Tax=Junco hyemalis TaxID=40217 RepID=A0A8C5J4L2_JUNHY
PCPRQAQSQALPAAPVGAVLGDPCPGQTRAPRGGPAARRGPAHFLQLEQIGGQLSASLLHCHDTETRATMTMALAGDVIAAGQDNSCHILRFSLQEPEAPGAAGKDGETLLRCCGAGPGESWGAQGRAREVRVESLQRVRTDFSPDALQKAVRFSADGALLATGGADGFLRLWEVGTACWGHSRAGARRGWDTACHRGDTGWGHRGSEGSVLSQGGHSELGGHGKVGRCG